MLSFFRGLTKSRIGIAVLFALLVVIALAFALGDITGLRANGGSGPGAVVARVGNRTITEAEVRERLNFALNSARQQGQTITMEEFLKQGALDGLIEEMIDVAAMEEFAQTAGVSVGRKTVDGMIAAIPAFQGPDGKFDQKAYERLLSDRRITDKMLRDDLTSETYRRWLISPIAGASQVPTEMTVPYASLLLERRVGQVALIPTQEMDVGAPPSDAELAKYYDANKARYVVPERRIVRFARVLPETVAAQATPSEADIANAYRAAGTRFAATEKRTLRQVIALDEKIANQVAEKVRGGTSLVDAARGAGLEATAVEGVTKADFARQSAPAVADAAFAAAEGGMVGPLRAPSGFYLLRVEKVEKIAAKSLAEAHDELANELRQNKTIEALRATFNQLDDGLGAGKTFDELVRDAKLSAEATPGLLPNGANPDEPQTVPNPALQPILKAAFAAEPGASPQMVPLGNEPTSGFAIVKLERVIPPTQRALKDIQQVVLRDFRIEKAVNLARAAANKVVDALNRGVPLDQAIAATGVNVPKPAAIDATRNQLRATGREIPPPIALMFQMTAKKAKLLQAPQRSGYYVVYLDSIEKHDARGNAAAIGQMQQGLASTVGNEYLRQFVASVRDHVKVTKDDAEIARLRADLLKQGR